MKLEYIDDDNNDINGIIALMNKLVRILHLHDKDLNDIVWGSIERILNVTIGEILRNYRMH